MDVDQTGRGSMWFDCEDTCVVEVQSAEPISLTYYILPTPTHPNILPTMTVGTPVERYNSHYEFTVDLPIVTLKGVIVSPAHLSKDGFRLNQGKINCEGIELFTPISAIENNYNLCWMTLTAGAQLTFKHTSGERASFGLFVYRITTNATLDYPMNMRMVNLWDECNATTPAIGDDGLDNDCDGRVDEELKNGVDDDGDGDVDEDVSNDDPAGQVNVTDAPGNAGYNTSDGNSTLTPPPKGQQRTTPKPTRFTNDLTKTYIVCASVFIGVPLLVLSGLAIEACVLSFKDRNKKVWKKPKHPEVVPIVNLPMDDVGGPAFYQEPTEEEKRKTPSDLMQSESSC